jgi:diguanylate cyclase (GGDEF)-like protein
LGETLLAAGLTQAVAELHALEDLVSTSLFELDRQSAAVAEANVRAVELAERLSEMSEELQTQNEALRAQNELIAEAHQELEQQSRATADATVEAVLAYEDAASKVDSLLEHQGILEEMRSRLERKAGELEEQARSLSTTNASLQEKVFIDEMTGLFNHRYFRAQLELEVARAHRYGRPLSLVLVDLDRFKQVNDSYGHQTGDQVLKKVSRVVQSRLRRSDITVRMGAAPVPARYGGEELVIILPETTLGGATQIAERVREGVEAAAFRSVDGRASFRVTVSAGAASLTSADQSPTDLISRADKALYRAKQAGRNRVSAEGTELP